MVLIIVTTLVAAGAGGEADASGGADGAGASAAGARKTAGKGAGSSAMGGAAVGSAGVDLTGMARPHTVSGAAFDYDELVRRSTTKGVGGAMKGSKKKAQDKKRRGKKKTGKGVYCVQSNVLLPNLFQSAFAA